MSQSGDSGRALRTKPKQKESFDPSPAKETTPRKRSTGLKKKESVPKVVAPKKPEAPPEETCPQTICLQRNIQEWIGCDTCPQWYHLDCAQNISKITINQDEEWHCPKCHPQDFNHDVMQMLPQVLTKSKSEGARQTKALKVETNTPLASSGNVSSASASAQSASDAPIQQPLQNAYARTSFPISPNLKQASPYPQVPISSAYPYHFTTVPNRQGVVPSAPSGGNVAQPPPLTLVQPNTAETSLSSSPSSAATITTTTPTPATPSTQAAPSSSSSTNSSAPNPLPATNNSIPPPTTATQASSSSSSSANPSANTNANQHGAPSSNMPPAQLDPAPLSQQSAPKISQAAVPPPAVLQAAPQSEEKN